MEFLLFFGQGCKGIVDGGTLSRWLMQVHHRGNICIIPIISVQNNKTSNSIKNTLMWDDAVHHRITNTLSKVVASAQVHQEHHYVGCCKYITVAT
jgi:hypothetical protein